MVSDKFYKRFKKRHNLKEETPDLSTAARDVSCKCPRMSFVWYLVCYLLSAFLPAVNKWNFDCSTYVFTGIGQGDKICSLAPDSDLEAILKEIDTEEEVSDTTHRSDNRGSKTRSISNDLPFAIKVGALINAGGEKGPAIMIISTPKMPEGEWHVEEVKGLGFTCEIGQVGYLYFSKTRCGTKSMWNDVFKRCILPTIKKSNDYHQTKDINGQFCRNFFSTDGEDIIISNAYEDEMVQLFRDLLIDYGRVGAGTTAIHNACDRWVQFKLSKYSLRKWRKEGKIIINDMLKQNLNEAFRLFRAKYPQVNYLLIYRLFNIQFTI
jgi:hypothetical protein